jgi:Zn-dependent protease
MITQTNILVAQSGRSLFNLQLLALSGLTVGIGFLFHEMGHKFVAQRMGFPAEFRAFDTMLVVAILLSFTGFVFAAPGAVFIGGLPTLPTKDENGKISTAGPGASLLLATFFLIPSLLFNTNSKAALILEQGFAINAWWAFFNLLPFPNFDGPKIFRWNKVVYGLMAATAFTFYFDSNSNLKKSFP